MVAVAQLVPQNVEKLPLWHWHPGQRVLVAGDRDGAAFDREASSATGTDFQRQLTPELLASAQDQATTDGLCAAWRFSLDNPDELHVLVEHARGARVVMSSGHGDSELLARVIGAIDAWVLLIGDGGPLDDLILESGRHVEVVLGLESSRPIPQRHYQLASAVHLVPRRAGSLAGETLTSLEGSAREMLEGVPFIYGQAQRHTHCRECDRVLIWRYGGKSRVDGINVDGCCASCGASIPIKL